MKRDRTRSTPRYMVCAMPPTVLAACYMLRRAIDKCVAKDRLARAFNVNLSSINSRNNLLHGICPKAVELLQDHQFAPELMIAANSITAPHADALLNATPSKQRSDTPAPKADQPKGDPLAQIVRLEREMSQVQTKYKDAEQNYGWKLLNLVVAKGYLTRLIGNAAVKSYIGCHAPEILEQFELVANTLSMEEALQQEAASTSETPPPDAAVGLAGQVDPSDAQDG